MRTRDDLRAEVLVILTEAQRQPLPIGYACRRIMEMFDNAWTRFEPFRWALVEALVIIKRQDAEITRLRSVLDGVARHVEGSSATPDDREQLQARLAELRRGMLS